MAATSATGGIVKLRLLLTQVSPKLEVAIICPDNVTKIHEFYQASFEPRKKVTPTSLRASSSRSALEPVFWNQLHPGKWRAKRTWNHHLFEASTFILGSKAVNFQGEKLVRFMESSSHQSKTLHSTTEMIKSLWYRDIGHCRGWKKHQCSLAHGLFFFSSLHSSFKSKPFLLRVCHDIEIPGGPKTIKNMVFWKRPLSSWWY